MEAAGALAALSGGHRENQAEVRNHGGLEALVWGLKVRPDAPAHCFSNLYHRGGCMDSLHVCQLLMWHRRVLNDMHIRNSSICSICVDVCNNFIINVVIIIVDSITYFCCFNRED